MTQNQNILIDLQEGKKISPLSALQDYGCMRLAARIWELRKDGHDIQSVPVTKGKTTWVEYKMAEDAATPSTIR